MSAPRHCWSARAALRRPAWWLALALLLLNDHYLKGGSLVTPLVTGKLSDFAGLFMAPALLAAALAPRSLRAYALAHVALGAAFTALKLSPSCADAWCALGAACGLSWKVVSDPSDLAALPMLGLSYWLFGARLVYVPARDAWRRLLTVTAGGVGFVACVATSRLPPSRAITTENAVYVGAAGKVAELNRATGKVQRLLPCRIRDDESRELVGEILYTAWGNSIDACDLRSGRVLWERQLDSVSLVRVDDTGILARNDERIWALDPVTGRTRWELAEPNRGVAATAARLATEKLDGELELFRLQDGARLKAARVAGSHPLSISDNFYVFQGTHVTSLDEHARVRTRAKLGLEQPVWASSDAPSCLLLAASARQTGADDNPPALVAFDAASLLERWRLPRAVLATHSRELVFTHRATGCDQNFLDAREAATGRPSWRVPWCPQYESAAADDELFIASSYEDDAVLVVARAAHTGKVVWRTRLDDSVAGH